MRGREIDMQPIFLTKTQIGNLLATTPEIGRRDIEAALGVAS